MYNTPRPTSRYSFARRLLFPYSGEEALSLKQSLRVLVSWALLIPFVMSLLALGVALLRAYPVESLLSLFVFAFVSGAAIFGILGWLIIAMNNRSARIRRAWKAREGRQ